MKPEIKVAGAKKLAGLHRRMSLTENSTAQLWKEFMQIRSLLPATDEQLYSLQVYPEGYFRNFSPATPFIKYALAEMQDDANLPDGIEPFELTAGLYAVFQYKGRMGDSSIFQYIYSEWLPQSGYRLDDRPHFEVLGPRSRPNDPESEEEIWIPVKPVQ